MPLADKSTSGDHKQIDTLAFYCTSNQKCIEPDQTYLHTLIVIPIELNDLPPSLRRTREEGPMEGLISPPPTQFSNLPYSVR